MTEQGKPRRRIERMVEPDNQGRWYTILKPAGKNGEVESIGKKYNGKGIASWIRQEGSNYELSIDAKVTQELGL